MHKQLTATILGLALGLASAEPALAFMHGQLLIGESSGSFDGGTGLKGDYRSTQVGASLLFDYFPPQIPAAIGVAIETQNVRLKGTGSRVNRLDHWNIGPELMVWLPLWHVQPYVKAALGYGAYTAKEAGVRVQHGSHAYYSSVSRRVALGVRYDKFPQFMPLIEAQMASDELDTDGATADLDPSTSVLWKRQTMLIGFERHF